MQVLSEVHTLFLGTDYVSGFGNSLDFEHDAWTNLASGGIQLVDRDGQLIKDGVVVTSASDGDQLVRVQLQSSDLALLGRGRHLCLLRAQLESAYYALAECVLEIR